MLRHPLLEEFQRQRQELDAQGRAMLAHVEAELESSRVHVHDVCYRVKSTESLAHKLARPDRTYTRLDDITDLVGLRVVTWFEDSIEQVARLVEAGFQVDMERSVDKRRLQDPTSFGYRSLHYICRHPEWAQPFEIQIRSILQHAWAEMEHDLGYKSPESMPHALRRRFSRLAGLLEVADSEFVELRRLMERYERDVRQSVSLEEAVSLDAVSLKSLVESAPVRELDAALAGSLGKPLADESFYPDYVVRLLGAAQLSNPARILQRLGDFAPSMRAFADRYFQFTAEAWNFTSERFEDVQRGYSLTLLAHWHALGDGELELHRWERMRRLYQSVDYPEDEAEARRVASLFVQRFASWK